MRYFLDTEFLEGTQKTWFGQSRPTIDLISIGIVCEDGREYYAISKDFNLKEAWNSYDIKQEWYSIDESNQSTRDVKDYWIRDNVLKTMFRELCEKDEDFLLNCKGIPESNLKVGEVTNGGYDFILLKHFTYKNLKRLINKYGKTNKQIAEEVYEFCSNDYHKGNNLTFSQRKEYPLYDKFKPEVYGYYSDYDWVVFCWLFGKMIDLPKGFPMYCKDLKQELSRKQCEIKGDAVELDRRRDYPKQTNEHHALADARWNYELYKFLNTL